LQQAASKAGKSKMDATERLTRRSGLALLLAATAFATPLSAASKQVEISYGSVRDQRLDVYQQQTGLTNAPVLLYVHGGAWTRGNKRDTNDLPAYAERNGFLLISAGYRLTPDTDAEGQAHDLAAAIAWAKDNAAKYGGDPAKIFLIGHSAGAHLVALVGVDPTYLAAHSMAPKDLAGVICLDGAGYLAKQEMMWFDARGGPVAHMFHEAFDKNPDGLSPALLTKRGVTYPPFIVFFITNRADSPPQARELAAALRQAGGSVSLREVPGDTHAEINQRFGKPNDSQGALAADFIKTGVLPASEAPPIPPRRGQAAEERGRGRRF
jgi:arylformamidase